MKSNKTPFIIAGSVILLIGFYFFLTYAKGNRWQETYESDDKEPYGAFALTELLKKYNKGGFEELKTPFSTVVNSKAINTNYVFVGSYLPVDSALKFQLLKYVNRGNNAFIASGSLPEELISGLHTAECEKEEEDENDYATDYVFDSLVKVNFVHPELNSRKNYRFYFRRGNSYDKYGWDYLNTKKYCAKELNMTSLGTLNDTLVNFFRIRHGKGFFYFHTNPLLFTNYYLVKDSGKDYSEKTFAHLSSGKIYWDEYSKGVTTSQAQSGRAQSPLKFILSEPSLRAGWYLLLVCVLVYIFFFAKRKQRIIPVLEANVNTSIEFTETIGRLYFQQNNHKKLCVQKMKLFLGFIRDRYHISTNNINEETITRISLKSEVERTKVEAIFQQYQRFQPSIEITADTLIDFHHAIDYFYKNCK